MAYYSASNNDGLVGDLGAGAFSDWPITLAAWSLLPNHPAAWDYLINLGKWEFTANPETVAAGNSEWDSVSLTTASTDGTYGARIAGATAGSTSGLAQSTTADATEFDGIWKPIVAVFTDAGGGNFTRTLYIGSSSNSWTNTAGISGGISVSSFRYFHLGNGLDESNGWGTSGGTTDPWTFGLYAECACWAAALSTSEIDSFCGGTAADIVRATNLKFYYPLSGNGTYNTDTGKTGPNLTLSTGGGSTWYDGTGGYASHPTISRGTANILLQWKDNTGAVDDGISMKYTTG